LCRRVDALLEVTALLRTALVVTVALRAWPRQGFCSGT
jgi:hypothetical protein